ncbi:hypothetical protein [Vreelandella sp. EE27]
MKKSVSPLFLAILFGHSTAVLAGISDEEHRLCAASGDMAEGAMMLRYDGNSQEETLEFFSEASEGFSSFNGVKLETMVAEAYQRPYHRSASQQRAEADDFGRVYYEGCVRVREHQSR